MDKTTIDLTWLRTLADDIGNRVFTQHPVIWQAVGVIAVAGLLVRWAGVVFANHPYERYAGFFSKIGTLLCWLFASAILVVAAIILLIFFKTIEIKL